MRILVIYYSYEGSTEFVARTIADHLKADVLKLERQGEKKYRGFMKYLWGGFQVFMKKRPMLLPLTRNLYEYDLLIIGTPVWAGSYNPVLESFFAGNPVKAKKIGLYCCHQGFKGNTLKNMQKKLEGNEIVGENDFLVPLSQDKSQIIPKINSWVEGLTG